MTEHKTSLHDVPSLEQPLNTFIILLRRFIHWQPHRCHLPRDIHPFHPSMSAPKSPSELGQELCDTCFQGQEDLGKVKQLLQQKADPNHVDQKVSIPQNR